MKILNKYFLFLYLFHIILSVLFNYIAYTSYLTNLHNSEGTWNFMRDSLLYHNEALILLNFLDTNDLYQFIISFNAHVHVKIISLLYYFTSFNFPMIYIPFHSFLWVISVLLIFESTKKIFNKRSAYFAIIPLFFISYLTLYMGLLRESFNILGYSLYIYAIINIYKQNNLKKNIFLFLLSFIILLIIRAYLIPIILIFSLLLFIYFYFIKKVSFRSLLSICLIMTFSIFLNLNSFLSLGYNDEHREIRNHILNYFLEIEDVAEIQKKRMLEESKFITFEWIDDQIEKQIAKNYEFSNKDYKTLNDQLLINELSHLKSIQPAIEKLIEIATLYKFNQNLTNNEEAQFIITLENWLSKNYLTYNQDKKIHLIRSLLNKRNYSEKKNIINNKSIKNNEQMLILDNVNEISQQKDNNCIFGKVSNFALKLNGIRADFQDVIVAGGSDSGKLEIKNLCDLFYVFPKAVSDGFLSPYPKMWFEKGNETGRIGRILSGIETLITYIFLLSFIFTLFIKRKELFFISPIIFLCFMIIIISAYAVPNYGALYRMRMGPILIIYILGSYSLCLLYEYFRNKKI